MASEGRPITESVFEASFGQRNDEILAGWLGEEATPDRIRRIGDAKEARYRALVVEAGLVPLPGAEDWVRALHAGGWLQAIASSAPRENILVMRRVLGFEDIIEEFVGAEDVVNGKPAPDVFRVAAARVGAPSPRCVVVEDAAAGVEAAKRAGMRCIGVGEGGAAADVVARSLADLPADTFERLLAR